MNRERWRNIWDFEWKKRLKEVLFMPAKKYGYAENDTNVVILQAYAGVDIIVEVRAVSDSLVFSAGKGYADGR